MSDQPEPQYHPIEMLPAVADLIEEGLADARETFILFQEARGTAHLLDDETVGWAIAYHIEGLQLVEIYAEQLRRWVSEPLIEDQASEVYRLKALIGPLRQLHIDGLAFVRKLVANTTTR